MRSAVLTVAALLTTAALAAAQGSMRLDRSLPSNEAPNILKGVTLDVAPEQTDGWVTAFRLLPQRVQNNRVQITFQRSRERSRTKPPGGSFRRRCPCRASTRRDDSRPQNGMLEGTARGLRHRQRPMAGQEQVQKQTELVDVRGDGDRLAAHLFRTGEVE